MQYLETHAASCMQYEQKRKGDEGGALLGLLIRLLRLTRRY